MTCRDHDGRSQLHYAAWHGCVACMKVLLSAFKTALNMTDMEKVLFACVTLSIVMGDR